MRDEVVLEPVVGRRAFLRGAVALSASGAAVYALGCGGGDGDDGGDATAAPTQAGGSTPSATGGAASTVQPVLLTSEFIAGQPGRFLVGLLDADNEFVREAQVDLKFFTVAADGKTGTLRGEGQAAYVELVVPASASPQGMVHGDTIGFYSANTPFDAAGQWAVEISVTEPGAAGPSKVDVPFQVFDAHRIPAPGTVPPASRNDTVATNTNTRSLCSRDPACSLHDKVIADVLGKGRPLVVQFSTPAFCETQFCGPVLDLLLEQAPVYQDRVDFVHIEVWQDFQLKQYRPATQEWHLPTEPITFFMAADGTIASFLEAVFTDEELTAALDGIAGA